MSEVKRYHKFKNGVVENEHGMFVKFEDYAELKAQRDALAAKGLELCREAAHVYQKYNFTQMPDMDLVDCQTIQEFSDLAAQPRAGKDGE